MDARLSKTLLLGIVLASTAASAEDADFSTRGGCPPRDDGLSCHGHIVLLGDPREVLLDKCGRAKSEVVNCYQHPYLPLSQCVEIWTYHEDSGSFPRRVTLIDNKVYSIVAQSRAN